TVTPTYPGVYVVELPSSVRTITAVSTSVTAFVGSTGRGPVNTPVTLTSFADFERRFGGLAVDSVLSYSVQQFFLNGGSTALVAVAVKGDNLKPPEPSGTVSKALGSPLPDLAGKTFTAKVGDAPGLDFVLYDPAKDGDAPATVAQLALLLERKLHAAAPGRS